MADIDKNPSQIATSALQAIPFGSLIGAPLAACIDAQAQAAKATLEYIERVGLNTDKDKNGHRRRRVAARRCLGNSAGASA